MRPINIGLSTAAIVFVLILLLGAGFMGLTVIEDGETGVRADFGKIADQPVGTGWHFYMRVFTWIEKWNIKTEEMKETAQVPSSEGLISTLDVSILYNIPIDEAVKVRKTIGRNFRETVLEPYIREAIRNIISGYEVKALYSEQSRKEIGEKISAFLKEKLQPRGIVIQDVLLRDVRLPAAFAQSIEVKLKTEQESLQKQFELTKAKKDAEIEVARAEGVAKSNMIIANSLSENYLKYQWIQGLQKNELQVVYVPTEASMPIMEAGRFSKKALALAEK